MVRFLRAWGWLRWRTFMNAIERSERADRVARLSRALEALGPLMVAVMMIPSAAIAMGLGAAVGYGLGSGAAWGAPLLHALRFVMFAVVLMTVVGPIVLPSGRGLASLTRLLLLPVSHKSLFAGEVLGGLAEPWTLLAALIAIMVPAGALLAGNVTLAAVTLVAALALIATLLATGALFGALLHVMMRDRKRGEWIVVLLFTLIPLAAMAPAMIAGANANKAGGQDWEEAFESRMEDMLRHPANGALVILPGELFAAAGARTTGMAPGSAVVPLLLLGLAAGGAATGGWRIWRTTIDRGGVSRGRARVRRARGGPSSLRSMRTGTRAVAFSFLQHVLRSARGRAIVLPSIIMVVVFSALVGSQGAVKLGAIPLRDGFSLAVFGVAMSFLTIVQLWMNQFAIDKAGLTMLSLQPLTSAQILRGKMAGAAILVAALSSLPAVAGIVIGASVSPAYWGILAAGATAAFVVLAPLAAMLSALFPKHVDLGSIGSKSNAHPAAGLLGGLLIVAAAAPAAGAALVGTNYFKSATAALGLTGLWLLIALALHAVLWKAAIAAFDRRRESLIAVANGR